MSPATACRAFVDPLAQDASAPSDREPADRGTHAQSQRAPVVPNLEGCSGLEAIDVIRSRGLIVAVETMEIPGRTPGVVVGQHPAAGTRTRREAVVTLRVAHAQAGPRSSEREDVCGDERASRVPADQGGGDDTAVWFAALAPAPGGEVLALGLAARRERDLGPKAITANATASVVVPDLSRLIEAGPLVASAATALARLTRARTSTWLPGAAVLAGGLLGLVFLAPRSASHTHGHPIVPWARASIPPSRPVTASALSVASSLRRIRRRSVLARPRVAPRPASRPRPGSRVLTASPSAAATPATAQPVTPVAIPAARAPNRSPQPVVGAEGPPAPFLYLGQ